MAKRWFEASAMKDIVHRRRLPDGTIVRDLECGHSVPQPPGGKDPKKATRARCELCATPNAAREPPHAPAPTDPSMLLTVGLA